MQLLTVLALASAATASVFNLETRQTPKGSCAPLHVIAIGGANSDDEYALGLLSTLTTNITAAVPGADYSSLPYNKVLTGSPGVLQPGAVPAAITLLGQYVSEYHSACPKSKIAIIGYSAGAVISSVAACTSFTVPQDLAGNTIVANVWYGAETYNPGQSYDTGTCTQGSGNQPLPNPAACGTYIPLTQSYCDVNDPQCCDGPESDYEIHFQYPAKYDGQATQFVVDQYHKFGGANASGGGNGGKSSSTSSSSSVVVHTTHTSIVVPTKTHDPTTITTSTSTAAIVTMSKPSNATISSPTGGPSTVPPSTSSPASTSTPPPVNAASPMTFSNGLALLNAVCIGAVFFGANLL